MTEISVSSTSDGVVAHLFPELDNIEIVYPREPTKKNPDILVDLGRIGGELKPIKIYYPPRYSIDDVIALSDKLIEKKGECEMCKRKIAEIMSASPQLPPMPESVSLEPVRYNSARDPQLQHEVAERTAKNITSALESMTKTVSMFVTPPRIPTWEEIMARASNQQKL